MWFLASVFTTLGAAYVYEKAEKSSEEIAILCVAIALGGFMLTLVAAPWQIQLLALLTALVSCRFKSASL